MIIWNLKSLYILGEECNSDTFKSYFDLFEYLLIFENMYICVIIKAVSYMFLSVTTFQKMFDVSWIPWDKNSFGAEFRNRPQLVIECQYLDYVNKSVKN